MTREEAIFCEKSYIGETNCTDCKYYGMDTCISRESHKMAIKALEQEPILDKIRTEIPKDATNGDMFVAVWGYAPSQLKAYVDWWNAPYKKGDKE